MRILCGLVVLMVIVSSAVAGTTVVPVCGPAVPVVSACAPAVPVCAPAVRVCAPAVRVYTPVVCRPVVVTKVCACAPCVKKTACQANCCCERCKHRHPVAKAVEVVAVAAVRTTVHVAEAVVPRRRCCVPAPCPQPCKPDCGCK